MPEAKFQPISRTGRGHIPSSCEGISKWTRTWNRAHRLDYGKASGERFRAREWQVAWRCSV
jgi:hypothetical protein